MKESGILTAICQYLAILQNQGKLDFIRNNRFAGYIQRSNGTRGFINNGQSGSPDIYIFLPKGVTIHCEVKNEKNKQQSTQLEYQERVERLGHRYIIVRSLTEVVNIINEYEKARTANIA